MMLKRPKLSIIIVNYNGLDYLEDCFLSIKNKCAEVSYEVIFVDNNSVDGSVDFVKRLYPEVHLIASNENLGFAKGNNLGVDNSSGEILLLLNNDTILLDTINPLLDVIAQDDIGVVGAMMCGRGMEERLSVGFFPGPLNMLKLSTLYCKTSDTQDIYDVDWIEGSLLVIERTTWDLVGGLDSKYFMYVEDIDFCKKVSLLGLRRVLFSRFKYIHYGGYGESRSQWLKDGFKIYANNFSQGFARVTFLFFIEFGFGLKNVKKYLQGFASLVREGLLGR